MFDRNDGVFKPESSAGRDKSSVLNSAANCVFPEVNMTKLKPFVSEATGEKVAKSC